MDIDSKQNIFKNDVILPTVRYIGSIPYPIQKTIRPITNTVILRNINVISSLASSVVRNMVDTTKIRVCSSVFISLFLLSNMAPSLPVRGFAAPTLLRSNPVSPITTPIKIAGKRKQRNVEHLYREVIATRDWNYSIWSVIIASIK